MTQPQPHEPVMGGWTDFGVWSWDEDYSECADLFDGHYDPLYVTLANGQRIIVRALSEERKAARRKRQEWKGAPL